MKIVSLIASSTEIVCSLGLEKNLVGRSHECDYPASVKSIPACSEPKIDVNTSAIEIDRQVKDVVRDSLSVYRVYKDMLKKLNPDVIVTQDHCEVCAVSLKDVEKAVCDWVGGRPNIVSLRPENLADLFESIEIVGAATGVLEKAQENVRILKQRMENIVGKLPREKSEITVACIEWMEPLMAAGNWVPELVEQLGAVDLFGKNGKHSSWMTWEELRAGNPDVMMIMPCGWGIQRTKKEMPVLEALDGWHDLKAVKNNQLYLTDGDHYFNRPGPRIVESMEIMAEILYPHVFDYGHKGIGWKELSEV